MSATPSAPRLPRLSDGVLRPLLCQAVDGQPQTRGLGIIFSAGGVNTVLRDPEGGQDVYLFVEAAAGRAAPVRALRSGVWRRAVGPRPKPAPEPAPADAPDTAHDAFNLGVDVLVLGLGVLAVVVTGGAAAPIEIAAVSQLVVGAAVTANDAARVGSDVTGHHLAQREDASAAYHWVSMSVFAYQVIGPEGAVSGAMDVVRADRAIGEAGLGWRDALAGEVGPGQRVKLGYALDLGGRSARVAAIRTALALKLANNIGAALLSLGLAGWGGPLADIVHALHFSLLALRPGSGRPDGGMGAVVPGL
ncbi:MAG: hypothetical protein ACP5NP_15550 [Acetobacteraceae bacterium]